MTELEDILPFLEGWRYQHVQLVNQVDPAGFARMLYKPEAPPEIGYILRAGFATDNPNHLMRYTLIGPRHEERVYQASPFVLNAAGLVAPNDCFWCPVFNPLIPLYSVVGLPRACRLFWPEFVECELVAVGMNSTIYNLFMTIIEIKDSEKWVRSWRRLSGVIPPQGLEIHTERQRSP